MSKHPKVSCWDEKVRLFWYLRLLLLRLSESQYSSDITSKVRIVLKKILVEVNSAIAFHSGYYVKTSDSTEKKYSWVYIENFRLKMRILKLHHGDENVRGRHLVFFNAQLVAKFQKTEGGRFRNIKTKKFY